MKILTVIVPSYNMERYLPKCLGSLVVADSALLELLEVIVVNDGSTDRTGEIAHEFAAKHPGVFRVIDKPNGHYGSCVNAALKVATGEYAKIVDADDGCDTGNLAAFVAWLDSFAEKPDMVASDYCKVDPAGNVIWTERYGFPEDRFFAPDESLSFSRDVITMHAVAHRVDALRAMGYRQMEGVPYTDSQWALTPIVRVRKMAYFPKVVTRYLVGRDGQTMEPSTLARDVDKHAAVSLEICRAFCAAREKNLPFCGAYYAAAVRQHVEWMTLLYAIGYDRVLPTSTGEAFDRAVRELLPDVHAAIEDNTIGRGIPFHFVREWRKDYSRDTWRFKAFRLKSKMAAKWRCWGK